MTTITRDRAALRQTPRTRRTTNPGALPMDVWRLITDLAPRLRPGRHVK